MDEKARYRAFVGVVVAALVSGAFFVVVSASTGFDNWATTMSLAIIVSMAAIALVVARRKLKDMVSGIPSEDERSRAIRNRAGYLALFVSMYFMFGMSFFHTILEDNQISSIPTSEWLMVYVAAMGTIFLVLNAYLSRKGVPE
jgi:formate hydrogenlyase subunit 4